MSTDSHVFAMVRFLSSTIGRKVLMAVTGLALFIFLVGHLGGNLLLFAGPEIYNRYSHALISNPLIYLAEFLLLLLFLAHLLDAFILQRRNRRSRPTGNTMREWAGEPSRKSVASSTMIWTGIVILIFVPLHLWTFKFGAYYASPDAEGVRDLHRLVVEVFQKPLYVGWYTVAMALLGFHLWHGFGSAFDSLGVRLGRELRRFGHVLAALIAGGFLLIPVVLFLAGDRI